MGAIGNQAETHRRFLTVRAGTEWFAIESELILAVLDDTPIEPVPAADPGLLGIVRWRQAWLPAVQAAHRLGVGEQGSSSDAPILIVLGRGSPQVAVAFNEVGQVRHFEADQRLPAELLGPTPGVRSVVQLNGEFVSVLDADLLFTLESDLPIVASASHLDEKYQIVSFRIADQEFGVNVFDVKEIVRPQEVTRVPEAPAFIEGVMDLRGGLIPIIDLRKRFEAPGTNSDERRIVVVPFEDDVLGFLVDSVSDVVTVQESDLSDPPSFVRGLAARYVDKMARAGDRVIVVLDMDSILSSSERIQLEKADWDSLLESGEAEA